jgi:hypothetical protein
VYYESLENDNAPRQPIGVLRVKGQKGQSQGVFRRFGKPKNVTGRAVTKPLQKRVSRGQATQNHLHAKNAKKTEKSCNRFLGL